MNRQKWCVHTKGFLYLYGKSKDRVLIEVLAVSFGFRMRRLAENFPCRISVFISTAQARAKWCHRCFHFQGVVLPGVRAGFRT